MMTQKLVPRILFIISLYIHIVLAVHDSLNFVLPASKRECFYEDFDKNSPTRTIEAFVQSGGNLDISLSVHGPLDLDEIRLGNFEKIIIEERIDAVREAESDTQTFLMDFKPRLPGTYGICLDNRKSRFTSKTVQFDLRLASRADPIAITTGGEAELPDEEEIAVRRVKESMGRIQKGITKLMLQQSRDRHRLSLHSETNEISHSNVVHGSILETSVFIAAALFQIFFVRRWFASRHLKQQRA